MPAQSRIHLRNNLAEVPAANETFATFCRERGISGEAISDLTLALEEILTNIVRHGYADRETHEISLEMEMQDGLVTLRFTDDGKPFDPSKASQPNLDLPADKRAVGGLGIHLVRKLTDSLEYQRENGKNVLTIRKRITASDQ